MSEKKEPVIKLEEYYKTDEVCHKCNGPLELHRVGMCTKCKLRMKSNTFMNIIEGGIKDLRMDTEKYMKVKRVKDAVL